jgi:hypothetical protein
LDLQQGNNSSRSKKITLVEEELKLEESGEGEVEGEG